MQAGVNVTHPNPNLGKTISVNWRMKHIYNDGGRSAAGYSGKCGDCAVRAIAIATEQPYEQVYQAIANVNASTRGRLKSPRHRSPRNGVNVQGVAFKRYMATLDWTWMPTMGIGTGCTVHLADGELPMGRLIVRVSKHVCAVIDGVIHDTHDPSERSTIIYPAGTLPDQMPKGVRWLENGNGWAYEPKRCVYGYWRKAAHEPRSVTATHLRSVGNGLH